MSCKAMEMARGSERENLPVRKRWLITEALSVLCISICYMCAALSLSDVGFGRLLASLGWQCAGCCAVQAADAPSH